MSAQMEPLLDDPIEILLAERALQLAKSRSKWNAIRDFYRPIINAVHRLGIEPGFSNEVDMNFAGDAHKLAAVVRILRTAGFETDAKRPVKGDTSWSAYYTHPDCATRVWLYFTSSVCKRVKTGTKTVEVDVFETQCGDIVIEEDAPPALTLVSAAPQIEEEIPF